jgi:dienelactone hydrolase
MPVACTITNVYTATKPTIIIIHGAWHVPQSYDNLVGALECQGYEVHVPRLPSINGARPPNADLFSDSLLIRCSVESLVRAGRVVVALMHSYGGQAGSNALYGLGVETRLAQGLPGGVSQLIYMAGYAVPEGTEMMDKVREFGNMDHVPIAFDFAEDDTCVHRNPKLHMVGPGPSDKDINNFWRSWSVGMGNACINQANMLHGVKFLCLISIVRLI